MTSLKSESLKELGAALAKAQNEMSPAGINSDNPFYKSKYASFGSIVRCSRPALTKHGLSVIQRPLIEEGNSILSTMLLHCSGEYIESRLKIVPVKSDPQSFGSCLSYLKRYAYASIVGVISDDEDDDGESAMKSFRDGSPGHDKHHGREVPPALISTHEYNELAHELDGHQAILNQVLEGLKITSLREMPAHKYRASLTRIRELKEIARQVEQAKASK
jgi:hypothetical protein